MNQFVSFFRICFFAFLAIFISAVSIWCFLGETLTAPHQYLLTVSLVAIASIALVFGFLALFLLDSEKINAQENDAELAKLYGKMLAKLLEDSSTGDKSAVFRSFISFVADNPGKILSLVWLKEAQKKEIVAFCHAEILQAQLEVSAIVPEDTESSRWITYQKACSSTELFSRMDRVVSALK